MTAIKSTASVRKAYDATASLATYWATAYADTAADLANGATLREIADAWKAAKITPANKDSIGDMAEAHRLTAFGPAYAKAIADKMGEGTILAAHELIGRARKARGVTYVRGVLTTLESAADTGDEPNDEALAKAMRKAVSTLIAAKREPKPETPDETPDETGDETGDMADEATADEATTADADSRADAVIAILSGMVKGHDVPDEQRRLTMVSLMRELTAQWTYARDVEHVA